MDSDPFAVWDDPKPAASSSSTQPTANVQGDAADEARLSLEYQDEDPGWGVASASTSRANSPEKSRKPAPARSRSQASVSPLAIAVPDSASEVPTIRDALAASRLDKADPAEASKLEKPEAHQSVAAEESGQQKDGLQDTDDTATTPQDSQPAQPEAIEQITEVQESAEASTDPDGAGAEQKDDGFDDFGEPSASGGGGAENDDFGDFDDFETGDAPGDDGFGDDGFGDDGFDDDAFDDRGFNDALDTAADTAAPAASTRAPLPVQAAAPTRTWSSLDVSRTSTRLDLAPAVSALLPLSSVAEKELTSTALRQVEGAAQVLVSAGSREIWTELSSTPSIKPIDWVRSKTRRDYLISMGVPVNLDEIHSSYDSQSGRSGQLPPLQLKYDSGRSEGLQRSSSLKLTGTASGLSVAQRSASTSNSPRDANSPALGTSTNRERLAERRREELGLGPAPQVDLRRAEELVNKTEDQLTLLSLPALQAMVRELNTLTTSTSSLLTHHLTLRESFQADSEMYNAMIKELVTGAASRFSGGGAGASSASGGRGDMRRSTTMGVASAGAAKTRVNSLPPAGLNGRSSPSLSLRGGAASSSSPRR